MFKKLKDKLTEEVKSSPQRLQQFAQAAQAAVTSASSSISDITNNDLFSIGDSDSASRSQTSTASQQSTFRDMSPILQGPQPSGLDSAETIIQEESQRQRRLSNSSLASDISFRLPSYESPSMYHLQSDMEVSASEAEDRGLSGGTANLARVTKEQLYSAYRHTYDRCKRYKTQYADLARHYKLLERENAKAKNVLVETQDKALRRISELREQCSLEQSAKAHLERALRIEIEEKSMKIHSLNTKLELLQNTPQTLNDNNEKMDNQAGRESEMQLINLNDNEQKESLEESLTSEILVLNNKLEKMEQLMNKYKESLKVVKEKNAQMTTEIQILSTDLQIKAKENEELKEVSTSLSDSKKKIQELNDIIEELQNKCNTYEFNKSKETSILELNLQSAQEDIIQLQSKIEELKKKEEEYAISLAENKLSIHKELESKEAEIKSLKDSLTGAQNEIQSLHIVINDYKNNISTLEAERLTLKSDINDFNLTKSKINDMEVQLEELRQKCHSLENSKAKLDEQYKCLQLQLKQETAEKLAMVDRNTYLETRNSQLTEENMKKSSQINDLESKIESVCNNKQDDTKEADSNTLNEIAMWKAKYENLEMEIQDEREELIKLQSEIEKLLRNYELVQTKNVDLIHINSELSKENIALQEKMQSKEILKGKYIEVISQMKDLREAVSLISNDLKIQLKLVNNEMGSIVRDKIHIFNDIYMKEMNKNKEKYNELKVNYDLLEKDFENISNKNRLMTEKIQDLKQDTDKYKLKIEEYKADILNIEEKSKDASKQHQMSVEEITALEREIDSLKNTIDSNNKQYLNIDDSYKTLETENRKLREELTQSEKTIQLLNSNLDKEKDLCAETIKNAAAQDKASSDEIVSLRTELENLRGKIEGDEIKYSKTSETLIEMEQENRNLREKVTCSENSIQLLNIELDKEKHLCQEKIEEIGELSNNYTTLMKDNEEKKNVIIKLQENVERLAQENSTLNKLSETISANVNKLENEMDEVRKSHAEIEKEKNHLNSIIEQLEKNNIKDNSHESANVDFIQTEKEQSSGKSIISEKMQTTAVELESELLTEKNAIQLQQCNTCDEQSINKMTVDSVLEQKYSSLQNEHESLKEDNRRLQSDIEGLQTYLAKISKENSVLNDKLREYFASGEKNEMIDNEIEELKSEIQAGKEKIDNLIRENTILIEENLELKDQIQSQPYRDYPENKTLGTDSNTEQELQNFKDKYNNLLDEKFKLEKRLKDVELMNQSVDDNMHQMQVNNERLRLSNEKLERRLDEALVSLRHLHSLQENTELEYLRNILYEYLTGSGTHSLTLAKVLSAVVKFNDSQTDTVLQKERERQGFLRQMGLL